MPSTYDNLNLTPDNLRGFLIENLNKTKVYTDQIYDGSNISALTDLHTSFTTLMLYYLNQSVNQGQFTETEIYENMNRIVKFHDYKPLGYQTSLLNFRLFAQNIVKGIYSIPRFSFVEANGIRFSFNEDITIYKTTDNTLEEFTEINKNKLLYQGTFVEHPQLFAQGIENENILISFNDNDIVDHFNIFVFVKDVTTSKWTEWDKAETLMFEKGDAEKYEIRLNENLLYELTFGDNRNGKKLNVGDEIAVYYLKSDAKKGEITTSFLNNKKLKVFYTPKLTTILKDIEPLLTYITDGTNFVFQNDCPSTYFKSYESIEEIRRNAPKSFRGQYKIVQTDEYASFVRSNFSNLIQDSSIFSNEDYLNEYYSFYKKLNLFDANSENRVTQNLLLFGNSCNFNNVYCPIVPKTILFGNYYITDNLKKLIKDSVDKQKCTTANFVPFDPIYLNLFLGVGGSTTKEEVWLEVTRSKNTINDSYILHKISEILKNYFDPKNYGLGLELKINNLNSQILGIEGVLEIKTINTSGEYVKGLQFNYTDLNFPETIAGVLNTNTSFSNVFCWVLTDLDYLLSNIKFV